MSIQTLIEVEPLVAVLRQSVPGDVDAEGIPIHGLITIRSIQGRVASGSASQVDAWRTLGIEANYTLHALDGEVENGQFVRTADDRLFRVTALRQKRYAKGNIPTHFSYAIQEITK